MVLASNLSSNGDKDLSAVTPSLLAEQIRS
jgi:hypothetical protein